MRIICKFPTRNRPNQFLSTLKGWIDNAEDLSAIYFLCNYDTDDLSMTEEIVNQAMGLGGFVIFNSAPNPNKISAFNAHMTGTDNWEIALLLSDDFFCRRKGWDNIIRNKMKELYPDTDGFLHFHDGSKQRVIATQSCVGRKFFDRTGYFYHPTYASFFCDNEETDKAKALGRYTFIEQGISTHEHPSWAGSMKPDATYQRNNRYWKSDEANYRKRKAEGFPK